MAIIILSMTCFIPINAHCVGYYKVYLLSCIYGEIGEIGELIGDVNDRSSAQRPAHIINMFTCITHRYGQIVCIDYLII